MVEEFSSWPRSLRNLLAWMVGLTLALIGFLSVGFVLIFGDGEPGQGDDDAALHHAARVAAEASLPRPFPGADPWQVRRMEAWELGRRLGKQMLDLAEGEPADGRPDLFFQAECELLAQRLGVSLPPLPVPSGEPLRDRQAAERVLRDGCLPVAELLEQRGDEQTTRAFQVALRLHFLVLVYQPDWKEGDDVDLVRQHLVRSSNELDASGLPWLLLWLRVGDHEPREKVADGADVVLNVVGMSLSAG